MSVTITEREIQEALAEIGRIRQANAKIREKAMPAELFDLVEKAMKGNRTSHMTWEQTANFLKSKGWWNKSAGALEQAMRRERKRQQGTIVRTFIKYEHRG